MSKSDIPDEIVDYACGCKGERRGDLWSMVHCKRHGHIVEAPEPHVTVTLSDDRRSADVVFNDAFWRKLYAGLAMGAAVSRGVDCMKRKSIATVAFGLADAMAGQEVDNEG